MNEKKNAFPPGFSWEQDESESGGWLRYNGKPIGPFLPSRSAARGAAWDILEHVVAPAVKESRSEATEGLLQELLDSNRTARAHAEVALDDALKRLQNVVEAAEVGEREFCDLVSTTATFALRRFREIAIIARGAPPAPAIPVVAARDGVPAGHTGIFVKDNGSDGPLRYKVLFAFAGHEQHTAETLDDALALARQYQAELRGKGA